VLVPLHFSSLVLDISETYSERAARVAPILREFMFVIPRVGDGGQLGRLQ
jgi:hypothetical protein